MYQGLNKEIYETFSVNIENPSPYSPAKVKPSHIAGSIPKPPPTIFKISALQKPRDRWYTDYTVPASGYYKQDKFQINPPKFLSSLQGSLWEDNTMNVDARPRFFDKISQQYVLVDTGAATSIIPATPDDVVDESMHLQTVSGETLQCYGKKPASFQLGRKTYPFQAVIAKVDTPILGWDFISHFRLNFEWDDYGDIHLYDKKAQIRTMLQYVTVPHKSIPRASLVSKENSVTHLTDALFFQANAIKSLHEENVNFKPDLSKVPSDYQKMLQEFPEILTPNFKNSSSKFNFKHRILTNDESPCTAKMRPLMPGSPKAIEGEKSWRELEALGIVEKVPPDKPIVWSSALHLQPKSSGGLRPCGDYRSLNAKTQLDTYSLPNIRYFANHIKGAKYFAKLDLFKAFHSLDIDERDQMKTCILTPWGPYIFKKLSMGLKNSPQAFQAYLDFLLKDFQCFNVVYNLNILH